MVANPRDSQLKDATSLRIWGRVTCPMWVSLSSFSQPKLPGKRLFLQESWSPRCLHMGCSLLTPIVSTCTHLPSQYPPGTRAFPRFSDALSQNALPFFLGFLLCLISSSFKYWFKCPFLRERPDAFPEVSQTSVSQNFQIYMHGHLPQPGPPVLWGVTRPQREPS